MDNLGMTRLGVAALSGDAERVKEHLAKDDAFERDAVGNTVAHYAAVSKRSSVRGQEKGEGGGVTDRCRK